MMNLASFFALMLRRNKGSIKIDVTTGGIL